MDKKKFQAKITCDGKYLPVHIPDPPVVTILSEEKSIEVRHLFGLKRVKDKPPGNWVRVKLLTGTGGHHWVHESWVRLPPGPKKSRLGEAMPQPKGDGATPFRPPTKKS